MTGTPFTKGYALLLILMDNVSDPEMLYRLVTTCSLAKNAFEEWPSHFLKVSLSSLQPDVRQAATAYVAAKHQFFSRNPNTRRSGEGILTRAATSYGHQCHKNHKLHHLIGNTVYTAFVEEHLGSKHAAPLPAHLATPLRLLKRLSLVHEAVEEIVHSSIWSMAREPISRSTQGAPRSAIEEQHIRRALWRLHLFCTLFWGFEEANALKSSYPETSTQRRLGESFQRPFLHYVGPEGTMQMAKVYDDLLHMLQNICVRDIGTIFECAINNDFGSIQHGAGNWTTNNERWLVSDVKGVFDGYFSHRLSAGLVFLAQAYRTGSRNIFPFNIGPEHPRTDEFLVESILHHECAGFEYDEATLPDKILNMGYEVRPVEGETSQWKLEIAWGGNGPAFGSRHFTLNVPMEKGVPEYCRGCISSTGMAHQ